MRYLIAFVIGLIVGLVALLLAKFFGASDMFAGFIAGIFVAFSQNLYLQESND